MFQFLFSAGLQWSKIPNIVSQLCFLIIVTHFTISSHRLLGGLKWGFLTGQRCVITWFSKLPNWDSCWKANSTIFLRCLWWQRWMVRVFGSSTDYVDPSEHLFPPSPSARHPWWPSILSHAARLTRPWGGVGERLCCLWKSISSLFDSSSNPIDNCCRFFPPDLLRYDWQINIDMYFRCTIWRFGIHIHCSMMITIKLINTFIISHSYLCVCICVWWENLIFILLLLFRHSVMSDSLWSHGLQHTRPPYPSPSPGACPNSCALRWWCHPTISSSAIHFSSHLQSFPSSGSFPVSRFFASGGQSIGASASLVTISPELSHIITRSLQTPFDQHCPVFHPSGSDGHLSTCCYYEFDFLRFHT